MEYPKKLRLFSVAAAVWVAAAFGLRFLILKNSASLDGRILAPRSALIWTLVFSLAGLVLLTVLSRFFRKTPCTDAVFSKAGLWVIPSLAGAVLIFAGNLPAPVALVRGLGKQPFSELLQSVDKFRLLTSFVGLIAAVLMAVAVLLRPRRKGSNLFWLQLPLILFAGMNMIYHFRSWSHDPIVLDIAPLALASICTLLGVLLTAGFSLRVGRRRSTALWCALSVIFTAMCLPDFLLGAKSSKSILLIWLGLALWCGFHAGMLVFESAPENNDAAPDAPAEAEAASDAPAEAEEALPAEAQADAASDDPAEE